MPQEKEYSDILDEIQRLRDEQQRLRDEQEQLRREKTSSTGHSNHEDHKPDGENKNGQSADASGKKEEKEESQGKNEGEKKDKEQPKPLKERARTYVRTHRRTVVFGAVGFLVAVVAGVLLFLYLSSYESTDDAQVDGHLNAISARITGTVTAVYVENNQSVTKGQALVTLDANDYNVALDQAKASYVEAEAQLRAENPNVTIVQTTYRTSISTSNSEVNSAEAAVAAAEQDYQAKLASIRQAEANNAKAQTDVARYELLVQREEISHEQFDTIVATAKTQAATLEAAQASALASQKSIDQSRAQLLQAQSRLDEATRNAPRSTSIRKAQIEMRQAALLSAKAQEEQALLNLSYTNIYAPVNGIVNEKTVEVGERIQPAEQMLIITQIDDIWITANFKETQLRKMRAGQPVDISVDAFDNKLHGYVEDMPGATGSIMSLLPPENATGNFVKVVQRLPVRIRLNQGEDPNHLLRPGMSVEPKVWLK
jgi:membrane fusion protein, multidrug efflux system